MRLGAFVCWAALRQILPSEEQTAVDSQSIPATGIEVTGVALRTAHCASADQAIRWWCAVFGGGLFDEASRDLKESGAFCFSIKYRAPSLRLTPLLRSPV